MIQSYATDTLAKTYPEASDISKAVAWWKTSLDKTVVKNN
jgi:hypothetical protein